MSEKDILIQKLLGILDSSAAVDDKVSAALGMMSNSFDRDASRTLRKNSDNTREIVTMLRSLLLP